MNRNLYIAGVGVGLVLIGLMATDRLQLARKNGFTIHRSDSNVTRHFSMAEPLVETDGQIERWLSGVKAGDKLTVTVDYADSSMEDFGLEFEILPTGEVKSIYIFASGATDWMTSSVPSGTPGEEVAESVTGRIHYQVREAKEEGAQSQSLFERFAFWR